MQKKTQLMDKINSLVIIIVISLLWLEGCSNDKGLKHDVIIAVNVLPSPIINTPTQIYGVTIDSTNQLDDILESLGALSVRPTTRIVFDGFVPATNYLNAATKIHTISYIMGEIVDSFVAKQYTVEAYQQRTVEYYELLADYVDIWEIGNEVNGKWLGDPATVAKKVVTAYQYIHDKGGSTALTLYYNEACWTYPWEEMYTWVTDYIPIYMKFGLDYVFLSYYEEDCNNVQPDWPAVFQRLSTVFPNANIGFGEVGTSKQEEKIDYIQRYYTLNIDTPRYIGGHFWWYYKQDMVPKTTDLWQVMNDTFLEISTRSKPLIIHNP